MPRLPKSRRGFSRAIIHFYGSLSATSFDELEIYLANRGYDVRLFERDENPTELPLGLPSDRDYVRIDARVYYYGDDNQGDLWNSLINIAHANGWSVQHHNDDKIRRPSRRG
jgi:hypothetical protein